jgi:uncharacterized protein (DUF488 family)
MRAAPGWGKAQVVSVGHSTRPIEELVALLEHAGVVTVADVRTVPRSRKNPQYEGPALARSLADAGIAYVHVPELGGLRHARKDSPNLGWRNASFRGYADYMATPGFEEGLAKLRELARGGKVALLCAEAVPWRCHRSLIADALLARGVVVQHVTGPGKPRPHHLTPFARVDGRKVTYPGDPSGDSIDEVGDGARPSPRTRRAGRHP